MYSGLPDAKYRKNVYDVKAKNGRLSKTGFAVSLHA